MSDPVNLRSLYFTGLCLKGWADAKLGRQSDSREVVLDLRQLKLCVDVARAELISFWEIWHERCYDAIIVDRPRCVVDVGANIGAFSLYQAMARQAGQVVAFEPSPRVFQRLAKNVEINGLTNVRVINAAVGSQEGMVSFAEGRMSINGRVSESGPQNVRCVTLDEQLREFPVIDILKVDTEGYETQVLRGASTTLQKTRQIALELHYPGEREEIELIVRASGFSLVSTHDHLVFYKRVTG